MYAFLIMVTKYVFSIINIILKIYNFNLSINYMSRMCDKLKCLGKRQELEIKKASLIDWLGEVSHIDFENISMYQNNKYQDAVKYFLDWVDRNKIYATRDELVSNIDANKQVLDLANIKLNEFKDMYIKIRELATLMADLAITANQRVEYSKEVISIQKQIEEIYCELRFNGMRVFNRQWTVRDNYESKYCDNRKFYSILSSISENHIGDSDNFDKIKNEIVVFANQYAVATTEEERAERADYLTTVIDRINKLLESEIANVETCYKELCRSRENIIRQYDTAKKNLKTQREQAKKAVEDEICNVSQQITYMSLCINFNMNSI